MENQQVVDEAASSSTRTEEDSERRVPLAVMSDALKVVISDLGVTCDVSLALLNEVDPTWRSNLSRSRRSSLTGWHTSLWTAWVCTSGVIRDTGLSDTFTTLVINRDSGAVEQVSIGTATDGTMSFEALEEGREVPSIPVSPSVPFLRGLVEEWSGRVVEWASVFLAAADLADPTWEDMTLAVDGVSASWPLFHMWEAWRALSEYAKELGVELGATQTYPLRAQVTSLRYAPIEGSGTVSNRTYEPGPDGLWVRAERQRRGWSQGELGRLAGIGQGTISGIETGRVDPSSKQLAQLKETFSSPIVSPSSDAVGVADRAQRSRTHVHLWETFIGPDELPALVRCTECGWSVLLVVSAATGFSRSSVAHPHEWTPLFDGEGCFQVVWCTCGAVVPVDRTVDDPRIEGPTRATGV